jgi:hypothetical protein
MKDLYNNLEVVSIIDPVTVTDSGAPAAVGDIDLAGFNSALIVYSVGTEAGTLSGTLYHTLKLEHADDDGTGSAGDYAAVAAADVLGVTPSSTGIIFTIDDPEKDNAVYKCGYVGGKRFLRITAAETGAPSGCPISVVLVKGHGLDVPAIS